MKLTRACLTIGVFTAAFVTPCLKAQKPVIPPTIVRVTPPGAMRGSTVTLSVEGRSLEGAQAVLFDSPGLSARIASIKDLPENAVKNIFAAEVPLGQRQEAEVELTIASSVDPGPHWFRISTPRGTSNLAVLDVGSLPETKEVEPNDSLTQAQPVELPRTLVGSLSWPGDVDTYQFSGKAGQEMVFRVLASPLGSSLRSVLALRDSSGQILAQAGEYSVRPDAVLVYKLPADGKYTISISDVGKRGGSDYFYRLSAGQLPYVTGWFPLGVRASQATEVAVKGANLGDAHTLSVKAPTYSGRWEMLPWEVQTPWGPALNKISLAVGDDPEILETEPNDDPSHAQAITIPVTVNGRIGSGKIDGPADEDYFRFTAKQGEHLLIEVEADRLGSPLDSVVEVLDGAGHPIPRAVVRCLAQTTLTLADRDSKTPSFRLLSEQGFRVNDYIMIEDELDQIAYIPDQPDADILVKNFQGERIAFEGTSPQAHAIDTPVYKAQMLEPEKDFPPNGLPVFHLAMRNDDGGPGLGKDSRLDFVAPKDGEYILHLKDTRGLQGEDFAYRLRVRDFQPDFTLTASPSNPNVPRGGRVPVVVAVDRTLGYHGPVEIRVKGLPPGVSASQAMIGPWEDSTTIIFSAAPNAESPATPFQIEGWGNLNGQRLMRVANPDEKLEVVSLMPPPDLEVAASPQEVIIEPGKEATVTLRVERKNQFQGRVPCNVWNLPPGIYVVNSGLNGVLVPEKENSRTFTLRAEDWAHPGEQPIYIVGTAESNSSTEHASEPILLKVRAREVAKAATSQPSGNR